MIVCPMKRALPPLHFCHARKYHLLDFATTKVQRCNLCRNASTALVQKNSSNTFKTAKTLPVFADAKIHELSSFQLSNKVSVTMESISLKPRDAVGKDLVSKCKDGYKALAAPILDIEDSARDSRDEGEIILGDFTIISNPDYAIVLKPNDLISFSSCLNTPNTSQYLVTLFEAHIPFHQFTFSSGALRMLSLPNAGGNSDNSEALSFDFLHRVFNAQLLKAEMEIKYANKNWKKTDYVAKIKNHVVGVSVTRAVGYPRPGDFSEDQAVSLLKKKLFGIKVSTVGVAEEDKWERQLLHIWVQDKQQANFISGAYQSLHPKLRGDTIVIVTIAERVIAISKILCFDLKKKMDVSALSQLLTRSLNPINQEQIMQDMKSFESYAEKPGFLSGLEMISRPSSVSIPDNVRQLALITLKNNITDFWTNSVPPRVFSKEEKEQVKANLLASVPTERNNKIATMRAVAISAIAVKELPLGQWPNLLPSLLPQPFNQSENSETLELLRHKQAKLHVSPEQASGTLIDRKALALQMAVFGKERVSELWKMSSERWTNHLRAFVGIKPDSTNSLTQQPSQSLPAFCTLEEYELNSRLCLVCTKLLSLFSQLPLTPSAALSNEANPNHAGFEELRKFLHNFFVFSALQFSVTLCQLLNELYTPFMQQYLGKLSTISSSSSTQSISPYSNFTSSTSSFDHNSICGQFLFETQSPLALFHSLLVVHPALKYLKSVIGLIYFIAENDPLSTLPFLSSALHFAISAVILHCSDFSESSLSFFTSIVQQQTSCSMQSSSLSPFSSSFALPLRLTWQLVHFIAKIVDAFDRNSNAQPGSPEATSWQILNGVLTSPFSSAIPTASLQSLLKISSPASATLSASSSTVPQPASPQTAFVLLRWIVLEGMLISKDSLRQSLISPLSFHKDDIDGDISDWIAPSSSSVGSTSPLNSLSSSASASASSGATQLSQANIFTFRSLENSFSALNANTLRSECENLLFSLIMLKREELCDGDLLALITSSNEEIKTLFSWVRQISSITSTPTNTASGDSLPVPTPPFPTQPLRVFIASLTSLIVRREVIHLAIGKCAFDVSDVLDVPTFVAQFLRLELAIQPAMLTTLVQWFHSFTQRMAASSSASAQALAASSILPPPEELTLLSRVLLTFLRHRVSIVCAQLAQIMADAELLKTTFSTIIFPLLDDREPLVLLGALTATTYFFNEETFAHDPAVAPLLLPTMTKAANMLFALDSTANSEGSTRALGMNTMEVSSSSSSSQSMASVSSVTVKIVEDGCTSTQQLQSISSPALSSQANGCAADGDASLHILSFMTSRVADVIQTILSCCGVKDEHTLTQSEGRILDSIAGPLVEIIQSSWKRHSVRLASAETNTEITASVGVLCSLLQILTMFVKVDGLVREQFEAFFFSILSHSLSLCASHTDMVTETVQLWKECVTHWSNNSDAPEAHKDFSAASSASANPASLLPQSALTSPAQQLLTMYHTRWDPALLRLIPSLSLQDVHSVPLLATILRCSLLLDSPSSLAVTLCFANCALIPSLVSMECEWAKLMRCELPPQTTPVSPIVLTPNYAQAPTLAGGVPMDYSVSLQTIYAFPANMIAIFDLLSLWLQMQPNALQLVLGTFNALLVDCLTQWGWVGACPSSGPGALSQLSATHAAMMVFLMRCYVHHQAIFSSNFSSHRSRPVCCLRNPSLSAGALELFVRAIMNCIPLLDDSHLRLACYLLFSFIKDPEVSSNSTLCVLLVQKAVGLLRKISSLSTPFDLSSASVISTGYGHSSITASDDEDLTRQDSFISSPMSKKLIEVMSRDPSLSTDLRNYGSDALRSASSNPSSCLSSIVEQIKVELSYLGMM
eukprot:MONOS_13615.3-p1 / transcript=MONOS_13615.3 / gene=MONOS_13615 / organism=Monocercomonoides_exilis_PA203 / gene_product=Signal transducing adapter molecule 2 / transcript_product=Signal transducing adapter molecule 2 / location=Mono_scaffold00854:12729-19094(+) / protein_length=1847 / sequence_SO=supercontig / SO=protein_coding / is_pseudo=false